MSKPKKTYTLAEVLLLVDERWQHIAADEAYEDGGQEVWVYTHKPASAWYNWITKANTHCAQVDCLFNIERIKDWENSCLSRKQAERMVK